jgi:hypothetical protein
VRAVFSRVRTIVVGEVAMQEGKMPTGDARGSRVVAAIVIQALWIRQGAL